MSESHYATGRRKTAVARVWLRPGKGKVLVNRKFSIDEYFGGADDYTKKIEKPLVITETNGKYDVVATVKGGGKNAQAEALRHGISRALLGVDADNRLSLKKGDCQHQLPVKHGKYHGAMPLPEHSYHRP